MDDLVRAREPVDFTVLAAFLDSLHSYNVDLLQNLQPNEKLCHYTSLEGAIGIIGGHDLWLTNSRFSNDDDELHYGHALVDEILEERKQSAAGSERTWLDSLGQAIDGARGDQVYIGCFCEKENLLSQWRGYAENGGGISIEFDPARFAAFTGWYCAHGLMRLWRVFYDREQQRNIVRHCFDYAWPAANSDERIRHMVDALQFFVPTFKNADFGEEEERRLIFTPYPNAAPKPKFRTRRGIILPYYSFQELSNPVGTRDPGFRLPIRSVLIGPGDRRQLNVQSARLLLDATDYAAIPVAASSTPLRG